MRDLTRAASRLFMIAPDLKGYAWTKWSYWLMDIETNSMLADENPAAAYPGRPNPNRLEAIHGTPVRIVSDFPAELLFGLVAPDGSGGVAVTVEGSIVRFTFTPDGAVQITKEESNGQE